ncbi:vWA domain-containing protein [Accumulibacter sp.]|uniref:vWA domain-containing protein n=1 Tax=Accumulibacter sp. TaxID=2053492 RepID=UPI0025FF782C|nr:vWA domain-containing protein [Accumulibacter sp.]MCP5230233.1 VWA domain-containing protein [Accumulibacter sp.]
MKIHTVAFIAAFLLGLSAHSDEPRFAITTPDEEQRATFELHDPDQDVRTLGTPEIAFDLSASADTLLNLRIRRSHLTLPDGTPFTAFAGHKEHNLIVIAGGPVAKVTITGVSTAGSAREVLVLFADAHGTLIAPASDQVAVFDTDFNPLPLNYRPAAIPQHALLPVTLALDVSGSMAAHMDAVITASRSFLSSLPLYARCRILTFNDAVTALPIPGGHHICGASGDALNAVPAPNGGTKLLTALDEGLRAPPVRGANTLPPIVLSVTDGVDTASPDPGGLLASLAAAKKSSGAKIFVFWAGVHEPTLLRGLADLQITGTSDVKTELERFFRSLGVSLSGVQVLEVGRN